MGRNVLSGLALIVSALLFVFSLGTSTATAIDKKAIAKKAMAEKHKYAKAAANFDHKIDVQLNAPAKNYRITLKPGKAGVPEPATAAEGMVTWKDIAAYEKMIARDPDPIAQWFIESIWRDRVNRVLDKLENRLKKEYPDMYKKVNIPVAAVAEALGIDPRAGFLTGDPFIKIPNKFKGRVPQIDPKLAEKALESSGYLSMYISSTPFIKEILEKVGDPETTIQPASEAS